MVKLVAHNLDVGGAANISRTNVEGAAALARCACATIFFACGKLFDSLVPRMDTAITNSGFVTGANRDAKAKL